MPRPTTSKATFPQKTAGNLQPATGRTDTRAVSDLTNCKPAVLSADWLSPDPRNPHVSTATGSPGCTPDQNPARVSRLVRPV